MIKKDKKIICIIIARGGSKGIKNKNLKKINGKPMIFWTIKHAKNCKFIKHIWVSSDSNAILNYSKKKGTNILVRPKKYANDFSSSEDAWLHAINFIEKKGYQFDYVLAPQVTSPLRHKKDFEKAINFFFKNKFDSLFSCQSTKEYNFLWRKVGKKLEANYHFFKRKRRQDIKEDYLENGSFYIFKKNGFLKTKNRLFGKIGNYKMSKLHSFEIDELEDISILNSLFKIRAQN